MAVSVSFLGGNGQIQSMDLPAGIDVGSYFTNRQSIPLSALGDKFQGFFGSPAGQSWLQTPEATTWGTQALPAAQSLFGGGGSPGQTLTVPGAGAALAQNPGSALTGLAAATGVPQFLSGIGNLGSNFTAGGLSGALTGLPAGASGVGGVTGVAGNVISSSAPEILRDILPQITGAQPASEATAGLVGAGGELGSLLPGLGAAASIGTGIADLVQGNIAGGAGSLGGAALGAGIGSIVPGIGTLLGAAIGGGGGGILGNLFGGIFGGHPSVFDAKRAQASATAGSDISALGGALHAGGTPEQILAALQAPSADFSSIAARNPVRSELDIPYDIARQIGLPVVPPEQVPSQGFEWFTPSGQASPHAQYAGGQLTTPFLEYGPTGQGIPEYVNRTIAQWSGLTTPEFQKFLSLYATNPSLYGGYIRGSGDVGYLPQGQAESIAGQARNLTLDALNRLAGMQVPSPGVSSPGISPPPVQPIFGSGIGALPSQTGWL